MTWRSRATTLALTFALAAPAAAQLAPDARVQPPNLAPPSRGDVSGAFASLSWGADALARGSVTLDSPLEVPEERGALRAGVLPTYAPERGQGEWGMGWGASLTIERFRPSGTIDYETDLFASPWGVLHEGDDGYWYPAGLRARVRVARGAGAWVATTEEGEVFVFGADAAVEAPGLGVHTWYLTSVEAPNGERTTLSYEDGIGRRYLAEVRWGGRGAERQYRMRFTREPVPIPITSYRFGAPQVLDERVTGVEVAVRSPDAARPDDPARDGFALRWRYALGYEDSPSGAAFHLSTLQRTFASGASEPVQRFAYGRPEAVLAESSLEPLPALDSYLAYAGQAGIQPDEVAFVDLELDGRLELEHRDELLLFRQEGDEWISEPLPPRDGTEDPRCRPAAGAPSAPRTLLPLHVGRTEPSVVVTRRRGASTEIAVCDRAGHLEAERRVSGGFELGANTRMTDLNRDGAPDIVRVERGRVQVLANESGEAGVAFRPLPRQTLRPAFEPTATWAHDVNGDGLVDLIGRSSGALYVWYGLGGHVFAEEAERLPLRLYGGREITDLRWFSLTFTDTNQDGLVDIVLGYGRWLYLFTNRGDHFAQRAVPAFGEITTNVGLPVAVDLEGRGEEQIVVIEGLRAEAITLSRPETGLLVRADDGKGGVVELAWERAPATPGIVRRPPLLVGMEVRAVGEAPWAHRYTFAGARFHGEGRFLLGFEEVTRVGAHGRETARFHHDDDVQGVPLGGSRTDDREPGLVRRWEADFEEARYAGLRWLRPSTRTRELVDGGARWRVESRAIRRWDDLCPVEIATSGPHGTRIESVERARLAGLGDAPHCLPAETRTRGVHPGRGELDFEHAVSFERLPSGAPTSVRVRGGGEELELQRITYDGAERPVEIAEAGKGTTTLRWDARFERLRALTAPDGVVTEVRVDGVTDRVLRLEEDRGRTWTRHFRFDALEHLAAQWDDVGEGDAARPDRTFVHRFAEGTRPARIVERTLAGEGHTEVAAILSAAGFEMATLKRIPEGWAVGAVTTRDRGAATEARRYRGTWEGALEALDLEALAAESDALGAEEQSTLGHPLIEERVIQEAADGSLVRQERAFQRALGVDGLVSERVEGGAVTERRVEDGAGRPVALEDGAGRRTELAYDALGRLVDVRLPDGVTTRSIRYDGLGRPAEVRHDDIGSLRYAYDDAGRLRSKAWRDARGEPTRRVDIERDAIGRVLAETHSDPSGRAATYLRVWDGDGAVGQRGRLSATSGPGYTRREVFDPAGRRVAAEVVLDGWRTVRLEEAWYDDGSLRRRTRTVLAGEMVLEETTREHLLDAHGRLREVRVDGESLFTLQYDAEDKLLAATFEDGTVVVPSFDATTRRMRGHTVETEAWTFSLDTQLDARGQVRAEQIELGAGGMSLATYDVGYGYDAAGFLASSTTDAGADYGYGYDANGLLEEVTRDGAADPLGAGAGTLERAGHVYRLDDAGRRPRIGNCGRRPRSRKRGRGRQGPGGRPSRYSPAAAADP